MSSFTEYIMGEKPCDKCGYNLQGLPVAGKCPECGHSIRRAPSAGPQSGTMSVEASTRFVKLLLGGFMILSIAIIGIVFSTFIIRYVATNPNPTTRAIGGLTVVGLHALWPIGIWIITTQRPTVANMVRGPILDNAKYRLLVRLLATTWVLKSFLSFLYLLGANAPTPPNKFVAGTLLTGYMASSFVSWIGLVPTSIYMGELAFWSSNESIGNRLRSTAWAMGVFGAIFVVTSAIALTPLALRGPAGFVAIFCAVIIVISVFVFMVTTFQLTHVLAWVIKHQVYAAGSADRVAERIKSETKHPGCINNGLRCRACKYDLNGLPHGGCCPECGESYAENTPFPIRDPALTARDEPEIDLAESTHQEILQYDQLDSEGRKRITKDDPDDGTIPLV